MGQPKVAECRTLAAGNIDTASVSINPSASEAISFGDRGQVRRGKIRVGWIEKIDDYGPIRWRLRFTPAYGPPGLTGEFTRRKDARAGAIRLLTAGGSGA